MQMFSTSSSRFSFLRRKVWKSGGAISDLVGIICALYWSIYQNLKGPVAPPPVPTALSSSRFSFLPKSFSTYSQNGGSLEGRRHTFDVSGLLNALNTTTKSIFFSFPPYNQSTLSVFFNPYCECRSKWLLLSTLSIIFLVHMYFVKIYRKKSKVRKLIKIWR